MAGRPTHVLDASAVIAYLKAEPGHEQLVDLLQDDNNVFVIHSMNLCEVYHCYFRTDGQPQADTAWENTVRICQICSHVDEGFIKRIARWKVQCRLAMLDSVAAAAAEHYACPLVTTDRNHFEPVAQEGLLTILFLR